jgi:hypothetical protein
MAPGVERILPGLPNSDLALSTTAGKRGLHPRPFSILREVSATLSLLRNARFVSGSHPLSFPLYSAADGQAEWGRDRRGIASASSGVRRTNGGVDPEVQGKAAALLNGEGPMRGETEVLGHDRQFPPTEWELVRPGPNLQSVDILIRRYWKPLYFYVRRHRFDVETSKDIVQAFMANMIARDRFSRADPSLGRFRTFVLAALSNFIKDWSRTSSRLKRGGGNRPVSLDVSSIESGAVHQIASDAGAGPQPGVGAVAPRPGAHRAEGLAAAHRRLPPVPRRDVVRGHRREDRAHADGGQSRRPPAARKAAADPHRPDRRDGRQRERPRGGAVGVRFPLVVGSARPGRGRPKE